MQLCVCPLCVCVVYRAPVGAGGGFLLCLNHPQRTPGFLATGHSSRPLFRGWGLAGAHGSGHQPPLPIKLVFTRSFSPQEPEPVLRRARGSAGPDTLRGPLPTPHVPAHAVNGSRGSLSVATRRPSPTGGCAHRQALPPGAPCGSHPRLPSCAPGQWPAWPLAPPAPSPPTWPLSP